MSDITNTSITQSELKSIFHYNPETGIFTRLITQGCRAKGSSIICNENKYLGVRINNTPYKLHRLAWLYMTGVHSKYDIDHKNQFKNDNRWDNLREVTKSINKQNMVKCRSDNKTGFLGVHFSKTYQKYASQILVKELNKRIWLGYFDTPEEAHEAYLVAKRKHHIGCTI